MSFSGSRPVPEPHGKVGTVWVEFQIIICSLTGQRLVTLAGLQGLTQRNWASPLTEWFHRKFATVAWQGPKAPNFPQAASQTADHRYISLRAGQRLRMETALVRRSDGPDRHRRVWRDGARSPRGRRREPATIASLTECRPDLSVFCAAVTACCGSEDQPQAPPRHSAFPCSTSGLRGSDRLYDNPLIAGRLPGSGPADAIAVKPDRSAKEIRAVTWAVRSTESRSVRAHPEAPLPL
jgi:hypothetical protein